MKVNYERLIIFLTLLLICFGIGTLTGIDIGKERGYVERGKEVQEYIDNAKPEKAYVLVNTQSDGSKRYFKFEEVKLKEAAAK